MDINQINIDEYVNFDNLDLSATKINKTLNPKIWDSKNRINQEVRNQLLKISKVFIVNLELDKSIDIKDIEFTGSLANYNYTKSSDIDVHIMIDFNDIDEDDEFLSDFFRQKSKRFNETYDINIYGYPVELYINNSNDDPKKSNGTYSLFYDKWVTKPTNKFIFIDKEKIRLKVEKFVEYIDYLLDSCDVNKINTFGNRLRNYRKDGLTDVGEYSTENIVFKILRHNGFFDKINNLKKEIINNKLSLK